MSIQDQKNALKESMKNHKNALKGSLKEQQAALEKSLKESTESAKEQASGFIAFLQRQLDRVVSPETRDQAYERMQEFAKERPFLFVCYILRPTYTYQSLTLQICCCNRPSWLPRL